MNCNGLGYDLQLDFSKFLQEARKHTNDAAAAAQFESAKMRSTTKKKKTWIRTLSLLFKFREKKSGAEEAAASKVKSLRLSGEVQKPRSGPLFGNSRRFSQLHEKMGLSSSGRLSFCFTSTRAEETEAPYSYLGHQNHPLGAQAFGPIYLVT